MLTKEPLVSILHLCNLTEGNGTREAATVPVPFQRLAVPLLQLLILPMAIPCGQSWHA